MATISNSARISGLASGLDVESIIDGLTQGTQTKIEQSKQDLQILKWKKEAYQDVTDALYKFQNTYCGASNGSMLSVTNLNRLTASSSSSYVSAVTTDRSLTEQIYISDIVSLASSAKVTSSASVSANPVLTADPNTLSDLSGKSLKVTLDGVSKTLTFSSDTYQSTNDVGTTLQTMLDDAFGNGRISATVNGDAISLDAGNSSLVLNQSGIAGSEASDVLSFTNGVSNRLNLKASLSDSNLATVQSENFSFKINGVTFSIPPSSTIQSIIEKVNASDAGVTMSYSETTDTFSILSKETGSGSDIKLSDINGTFLSSINGAFSPSTIGAENRTPGTDAVIRVGFNGDTDNASLVTLTRSSNTFDIDGTTFTLTGKAPGTMAEGINVSVGIDTEAAAKKITDFFTAYNDLLKTITDKLNETVYKGYKPLTESQKEDLTDKEIENWTEKAKSGLLNNDSALKGIYNKLRSAMTDTMIDSEGNPLNITLSSLGIKTTSYSSNGQLSIDQDKLLHALKTDSASVLALLAQSSDVGYSHFLTNARSSERYQESGTLWRVNDIIKNSLSTVGNTGALIKMVGNPAKEYKGQTTYSKKIDTAEDKIDNLLDKLDKEEDAYWKKYTALESAMSELNSMSGYLSSMLSA